MYQWLCQCVLGKHITWPTDLDQISDPRSLRSWIHQLLWCTMIVCQWVILHHWSWSRSPQTNAPPVSQRSDAWQQKVFVWRYDWSSQGFLCYIPSHELSLPPGNLIICPVSYPSKSLTRIFTPIFNPILTPIKNLRERNTQILHRIQIPPQSKW